MKNVTNVEYYVAKASCYKEDLNPDDELTGDDDPALALNWITVLTSRRFMLKAKDTGREIPALARTSKSGKDEVMSSIYAVDGHCIVSVGTRMNPGTAGTNALVLESFQFLK